MRQTKAEREGGLTIAGRRAVWVAGALSLICVAVGGCTAVVRPPAVSGGGARVYIADFGYHASLLLPREAKPPAAAGAEARYVEFSYGEWEWYALGRSQFWRTPAVALVPTRGALGRREWTVFGPGAATSEDLRRMLGVTEVHEVVVPAAAAADLLARLEARYAQEAETEVFNAEQGKAFVHDPDRYTLLYHCNTAVEEWMRELGCEVYGRTLWASFSVVEPNWRTGPEQEAWDRAWPPQWEP